MQKLATLSKSKKIVLPAGITEEMVQNEIKNQVSKVYGIQY